MSTPSSAKYVKASAVVTSKKVGVHGARLPLVGLADPAGELDDPGLADRPAVDPDPLREIHEVRRRVQPDPVAGRFERLRP